MQAKLIIAAMAAALSAASVALVEHIEGMPEDDSEDNGAEGTASATTVTDTTRDAAGLPWHPGIHAGTKKFKADGTWTRKKGVADTYYAEVVAELRKTNPEPTTTGTASGLQLPGATPTLALPGATTGLPVLTLPVVAQTNYQKLVNFITKNVDQPGRRLTIAYVNDTFKANGVPDPAALATNEVACEQWLAQFRSILTQIGETEAV